MRRPARWLVSAFLTVVAFGVSLWVCDAMVLPPLLKSEADRWVVAAALGVAVAAFVALWGASWAGQESRPTSHRSAEGSIFAGGDISGIASTGDHTTNVQQQ